MNINVTKFFEEDKISIYNADFLNFDLIENDSIDLIVTSPPYNLGIEYKSYDDGLEYEEYLKFTERWLRKCYSLLKDDGRICVNIPLDNNKFGKKPIYVDFVNISRSMGFKYQTTIIWNKNNISKRTAWGSFASASAPSVIAQVEVIVVLYKNSWKKNSGSKQNSISKEEFINWTNGLWTIKPETRKFEHPAPFPVELPDRCIKLFSYVDDLVLDPFMGSGTTIIAAYLNNRRAIGIEIEETYCKISVDRLRIVLQPKFQF